MNQARHFVAHPSASVIQPEALAGDALDAVMAGANCSVASAVSRAYTAAGNVMHGRGDNQMASHFYGRATGVIEGGCPTS